MQKSFFRKPPLLSKVICVLSLSFAKSMNSICRKSVSYPVSRLEVPDDKVSWTIPWSGYSPQVFTCDYLKNSSWADPDIHDEEFKPKWNALDGSIDRRSFDNNQPIKYNIVAGLPLNPRGRTGLQGRGRLGRWGPNHAADAVVTRWKRSSDMSQIINPETNKPVLQFLAILRSDCRKWAIPGGFVNPGEESSTATVRELFEEAVNPEKFTENSRILLEDFFCFGEQIYKGYVDDPRNTDNAWIETTATNFHDDSGESVINFALDARDDAVGVNWIDIVKNMDIYETHADIIKHVNELHLDLLEEEL